LDFAQLEVIQGLVVGRSFWEIFWEFLFPFFVSQIVLSNLNLNIVKNGDLGWEKLTSSYFFYLMYNLVMRRGDFSASSGNKQIKQKRTTKCMQ
jgi:hypothetical protein